MGVISIQLARGGGHEDKVVQAAVERGRSCEDDTGVTLIHKGQGKMRL